MIHIPVLLKEVLHYLNPQPGENFIDCTLGGGGHTWKILEQSKPDGRVLGIDLWSESIDQARQKAERLDLSSRLILVHDNFARLKDVAEQNNFTPVNGVLMDLGLSSDLLESSGRGFTFQKDEPLDMRYRSSDDLTARFILNSWPEEDLTYIFKNFGEERYARSIARAIVRTRKENKLETTQDLIRLLKQCLKRRFHTKSLARIFQALRIVVNQELNNLRRGLEGATEILSPGGRIVVISYHSLEDRIVKHFFKGQAGLQILTKKPVCPSEEEIKDNPRSRSAKLRAARIK